MSVVVLIGDTTGDAAVRAADLVTLIRRLVMPASRPCGADLDGNGVVDPADARRVIEALFE